MFLFFALAFADTGTDTALPGPTDTADTGAATGDTGAETGDTGDTDTDEPEDTDTGAPADTGPYLDTAATVEEVFTQDVGCGGNAASIGIVGVLVALGWRRRR